MGKVLKAVAVIAIAVGIAYFAPYLSTSVLHLTGFAATRCDNGDRHGPLRGSRHGSSSSGPRAWHHSARLAEDQVNCARIRRQPSTTGAYNGRA